MWFICDRLIIYIIIFIYVFLRKTHETQYGICVHTVLSVNKPDARLITFAQDGVDGVSHVHEQVLRGFRFAVVHDAQVPVHHRHAWL